MARKPKYTYDLEFKCRNGGTIQLDSREMAGFFSPSLERSRARSTRESGQVPKTYIYLLGEVVFLRDYATKNVFIDRDVLEAEILKSHPVFKMHSDGGRKQISIQIAYLENMGLLERSGDRRWRVHSVDFNKHQIAESERPAPEVGDEPWRQPLIDERARLMLRIEAIDRLLA